MGKPSGSKLANSKRKLPNQNFGRNNSANAQNKRSKRDPSNGQPLLDRDLDRDNSIAYETGDTSGIEVNSHSQLENSNCNRITRAVAKRNNVKLLKPQFAKALKVISQRGDKVQKVHDGKFENPQIYKITNSHLVNESNFDVSDQESVGDVDDDLDRFDNLDYQDEHEPEGDGVRLSVGRLEEQEFVGSEDEAPTVQEPSPDPEVSWDTTKQEFQAKCKNDPKFRKYLNELIEERVSQEKQGNNEQDIAFSTPKVSKQRVIKPIRLSQKVKSPSDTTLYTPALKQSKENQNIIDQISNFVEGIRRRSFDEEDGRQNIQKQKDDSPRVNEERQRGDFSPKPGCSGQQDLRRVIDSSAKRKIPDTIDREQAELRRAREATDKILVQAEQFKATLAAPKGNAYELMKQNFVLDRGLAPIDEDIKMMRLFDDDDEFFHVTSHIDPNMRTKIERGQFVDLEKLLPKDKYLGNTFAIDSDMKPLQLFSKGGQAFLAPSTNKDSKISGIKKWDQAFRVYAAIYTEANPSRSGEIWQYIHAIHTAAASYSWDSVIFYDITFRELMESKPWRSWGKTYSQGWNLALRANNGFGNSSNHHQSSHGNQSNGSSVQGYQGQKGGQGRDWRDDCCWRFNRRNRCGKTATECKWDHRCNYCGGWQHGYFNCRKRLGKRNNNQPGETTNNNSNNFRAPQSSANNAHHTSSTGGTAPPKKE